MYRTVAIAVLSLLASAAGPARAGLMYQITDGTGAPAASFTLAAPGDRLAVRVYLVETGGTELATNGLFSAGVTLTYDDPVGIAAVTAVGDVAPNAGFVNLLPATSVTASSAGLTGDVDLNPFLMPDLDGRILLGEFTLTALAPGLATLRALDRNSLTDDTLSGSFTVLDADIGMASASLLVLGGVTAVPEPSTLALGAVSVTILAIRWRRRGNRETER